MWPKRYICVWCKFSNKFHSTDGVVSNGTYSSDERRAEKRTNERAERVDECKLQYSGKMRIFIDFSWNYCLLIIFFLSFLVLRFHRLTFILLLFVLPLYQLLSLIYGYMHELTSLFPSLPFSLPLTMFASCTVCWCELGVFFSLLSVFISLMQLNGECDNCARILHSFSILFSFFFFLFNISRQIDGKIVYGLRFLSVEWVAVCDCMWPVSVRDCISFIKIVRNMRRGSMNPPWKIAFTMNRSMPWNSVSPTFRLTTDY